MVSLVHEQMCYLTSGMDQRQLEITRHAAQMIRETRSSGGNVFKNGRVMDYIAEQLVFPEAAITKKFSILAAQPLLHRQALEAIRKGVSPEKNAFGKTDATDNGYTDKFPVN